MKPSGGYDDQFKKADRIVRLIIGHLQGTLTAEEGAELDEWITESDENLALFEKLTDEDNIEAAIARYYGMEKTKAEEWKKVKKEITASSASFHFWPWLAAASLLLVTITAYWLLAKNKPSIEKPFSRVNLQQELPAGKDQAVLTLSDGRTLILDSFKKGRLASEGGISINQTTGGWLQYTGTETAMRYNTISTPRGGQYQLVLGDGTKVWLNADSYLKFPAGFTGAQRNVELKGEGYFEVAKDVDHPFIVNISTPEGEGPTIEVLGTHFNVNAYEDEGAAKTTLLEGLVKITNRGVTKLLHPGQQAVAELAGKNQGASLTIKAADVDDAVAWTKGKFLFRDASIHTIGEHIRRWYDVDVEYEGIITQHFNIEADRSLPLQKLLKGLEGTNEAQFLLQGRKLIIKPVKVLQ
jgi:ferric-dicitrate binding protein FerR (iron transport regulator)